MSTVKFPFSPLLKTYGLSTSTKTPDSKEELRRGNFKFRTFSHDPQEVEFLKCGAHGVICTHLPAFNNPFQLFWTDNTDIELYILKLPELFFDDFFLFLRIAISTDGPTSITKHRRSFFNIPLLRVHWPKKKGCRYATLASKAPKE